jgi:probable HAF family extracellular repeat protein
MTLRTIGVVLAVAAFAAFPARPTAQDGSAGPQTIVDLGTLGHDVSFAVAVNNKTQVIGWIADNFEPFRAPFLWEDGVMRELTSGPDLSVLDARDINDRGQIAGSGMDVATFAGVALLWEDNARPTRLPTPPGDVHCAAEAINDRGEVVGSCATPVGDALRWHAVLWRDGEVIDLASLAGAGESAAITINNRGVVLGAFRTSEGFSTGNFIWADGVLTRLVPSLFASDLNDRGQIAATGRLVTWLEALVLDRGAIVRLPSLSDDVNCVAGPINNRGDVGGWCSLFATIWVRGQVRALPALSEFVAMVTDVNDRGTAVGVSTAPSPDNNSRAVLWPGAAKHLPDHVDR